MSDNNKGLIRLCREQPVRAEPEITSNGRFRSSPPASFPLAFSLIFLSSSFSLIKRQTLIYVNRSGRSRVFFSFPTKVTDTRGGFGISVGGGANRPVGGANIEFLPKFPKNCMKL